MHRPLWKSSAPWQLLLNCFSTLSKDILASFQIGSFFPSTIAKCPQALQISLRRKHPLPHCLPVGDWVKTAVLDLKVCFLWFDFCVVLCRARSWTQWSLGSPSDLGYSMILWFFAVELRERSSNSCYSHCWGVWEGSIVWNVRFGFKSLPWPAQGEEYKNSIWMNTLNFRSPAG